MGRSENSESHKKNCWISKKNRPWHFSDTLWLMHVTSCHQVLNVMFAIAAKKLYRCCGCCWTNGTLPDSTPDSKLHDDRHCYMHSQHPGSSDAWLLPEFQPLPALMFWVLRWWYSIQVDRTLGNKQLNRNCEAELLNSEQKIYIYKISQS